MSSYESLAAAYDGLMMDGLYRKRADYLERRFRGSAVPVHSVLDLACDRCGKEFSREKIVPLDALVAQELEDEENDEILLLDGYELDMDEVVTTAFILAMDTKNLCSDDCKGLCSGCGVDLNVDTCRCKPEVDPRLAALAQLLDKETE